MAYAGTVDSIPNDGKTIEGENLDSVQSETDLPDPTKPVSQLDPRTQFRILKGWVKADADHSRKWRELMREWYAFRAGEQWTDTDKAILANQSRPVIVFNRVLTILKAVAGMEINGRHEISLVPVGTEDSTQAEKLAQVLKWMGDKCDAEDEESQAFDDTATCGMGWCEERMGYLDDPTGKYLEERIHPGEMFWDRRSKKKNLSDAKRRARVRRMPLSDAMRMFPGKTRDQLDAKWALDGLMDVATKTLEEKRRRDADTSEDPTHIWEDAHEVTIVHVQWIEVETYYLVADPMTGEQHDLTQTQYRNLVRNNRQLAQILGMPPQPIQAVKLQRNVYKQAFLGNEMLRQAEDTPIKGQFSWKCITGEFDDSTGTWFGLVKILRDPQMWANKWLSQILHILNTSAKGGILAELDAFEDPRQAEEDYAKPESITWMKPGSLSGTKKPKIMPKPSQTMTDGYLGLLTFAISSFKDVSGINLELLGQQDQNQPGILEAMRKQAGMTVLATLFDSLRRFRKQVGRSRLFFVQNYMSDGRIARITNSEGEKVPIQLLMDQTAGDYDVEIDDTPTSPNQKEANWAIIQPLIAVFKDQLMTQPQVLAVLLEYSPLPSRIVNTIKQIVDDAQNSPEAQQKQKLIEELELRDKLSVIDKNESTAELNRAKAGTAQSDMAYQMAMARNMIEDNQWQQARQALEGMVAQAKMMEMQTRAQKNQTDAEHQSARLALDAHDVETRRVKASADLVKANADNLRAHHEQVRSEGQHRIGMLVDLLGTVGKHTRDQAAAEKDLAIAERERRTPVSMGE